MINEACVHTVTYYNTEITKSWRGDCHLTASLASHNLSCVKISSKTMDSYVFHNRINVGYSKNTSLCAVLYCNIALTVHNCTLYISLHTHKCMFPIHMRVFHDLQVASSLHLLATCSPIAPLSAAAPRSHPLLVWDISISETLLWYY